jgi:ABC-type nitrate/sulfonate/bicarbonate transport system permease component
MQDSTKRTIRTAIQATAGFAAALPAIVAASGIPETLPWVAGGLAVASGTARIMALPAVEQLLDRVGLGLVDEGASHT